MRTLTDTLTAIDGVSARIADAVVAEFDSYAAVAGATTEELTAIKGVGPVLANRIQAEVAKVQTTKAAKEGSAAAKDAVEDATSAATEAADEAAEKVDAAATSAAKETKRSASAVADRADKAAKKAAARAAAASGVAEQTAGQALAGLAAYTDKAADGTELIARNFADHLSRREFGPVKLPSDLPRPVDTLFNLTEAYVTFSFGLTTGMLRKATAVLR